MCLGSLAPDFVTQNPSGHGGVEGTDATELRNPDVHIAHAEQIGANPFSFVPDHDGRRLTEMTLLQWEFSLLRGRNQPDSVAGQFLTDLPQFICPADGEIIDGSGGTTGDVQGDIGLFGIRDEHGIDSKDLRRTENCAEVERILNAVQQEDEAVRLESRQRVVHIVIGKGGHLGDDPLMIARARAAFDVARGRDHDVTCSLAAK